MDRAVRGPQPVRAGRDVEAGGGHAHTLLVLPRPGRGDAVRQHLTDQRGGGGLHAVGRHHRLHQPGPLDDGGPQRVLRSHLGAVGGECVFLGLDHGRGAGPGEQAGPVHREHLLDAPQGRAGGEALDQRLEPALDVPDAGGLGDPALGDPRLDPQSAGMERADGHHERGLLPEGGLHAGLLHEVRDGPLIVLMGGEHGVLERGPIGQDVQEAAAGGVPLEELLGVRGGHGGAAAGLLELADELPEEPARLDGPAKDLGLGPDERGVVVPDHVAVQQRPEVLGEVQGPVPGGEGVHGGVGEVAEGDAAGHEGVHLRLGQVRDAAAGHQVQARLVPRRLVPQGPAGSVAGAAVHPAPALGELGQQVERVQAHAPHEDVRPGLHGLPVHVRGDLRALVVQLVPAPRGGGHPVLAGAELRRLMAQAEHDGVRVERGDRAVGVPQLQAGAAVGPGVQGGGLRAVLDDLGDLGTGAQPGDDVLVQMPEVAPVDRTGRVLVAAHAEAGLRVHASPLVEGLGGGGGAQTGVVGGARGREERGGVHEVQLGLVSAPHPPWPGRIGVHDVDAQPPGVCLRGRALEPGEDPLQQHDAAGAGSHHCEAALGHQGLGHGASTLLGIVFTPAARVFHTISVAVKGRGPLAPHSHRSPRIYSRAGRRIRGIMRIAPRF